MPSKKGQNPADAARRQLKAKEKKRNKDARDKARDSRQAKADTTGLAEEIAALQSKGSLSSSDKSRLKDLQKDLSFIHASKDKAKAAAVAAAAEKAAAGSSSKVSAAYGTENVLGSEDAQFFKKDGKLKNPRKSIYYDPVYNPFGVPPPGMDYKERSTTPPEYHQASGSQSDSDGLDIEGLEEGDDQDTEMQETSTSQALVAQGDLLDEDIQLDRIPMPQGPAPPKGPIPDTAERPLMRFVGGPMSGIPPPPGPPPAHLQQAPPPPGPPPLHIQQSQGIPMPPGPPPSMHASFNPSFAQATDNFAYTPAPRQAPKAPIDLAQAQKSATISAEPQLRDFKKEATSLVPTTLKRKKVGQHVPRPASAAQVVPEEENFEQYEEDDETMEEPVAKRPSLMDSLKNNGLV